MTPDIEAEQPSYAALLAEQSRAAGLAELREWYADMTGQWNS